MQAPSWVYYSFAFGVRNGSVRTACETNTDFVHVPLDVDVFHDG
jgi:hypothetical protein